jgi:hypothetical protein
MSLLTMPIFSIRSAFLNEKKPRKGVRDMNELLNEIISQIERLTNLLMEANRSESLRESPEAMKIIWSHLAGLWMSIGLPFSPVVVELRQPVTLSDETTKMMALQIVSQLPGTPVTLFKCNVVTHGTPCNKGLEVLIDKGKLYLKCPDHGNWEIGSAK